MKIITRRVGETVYLYKNSQRIGMIKFVCKKAGAKGHQVRISNEHQFCYRKFYHASEHLFSHGGHVIFYQDPALGDDFLKMIFNLPEEVEARSEPLTLCLAS